jgi:hypothetical protein
VTVEQQREQANNSESQNRMKFSKDRIAELEGTGSICGMIAGRVVRWRDGTRRQQRLAELA